MAKAKAKAKKAVRFEAVWRNKFLTAGAKSIGDMAAAMQEAAEQLREMQNAGVTLEEGGVEDDYATLVTTDPEVAKRFGFEKA